MDVLASGINKQGSWEKQFLEKEKEKHFQKCDVFFFHILQEEAVL